MLCSLRFWCQCSITVSPRLLFIAMGRTTLIRFSQDDWGKCWTVYGYNERPCRCKPWLQWSRIIPDGALVSTSLQKHRCHHRRVLHQGGMALGRLFRPRAHPTNLHSSLAVFFRHLTSLNLGYGSWPGTNPDRALI